jgi:hypothetical protein
MQAPDTFFNANTNVGVDRVDGLVVAMISWWIFRGGLADICEVADTCSFEALDVKRDDTLGQIILAKRDYCQEMIRAVHENLEMCHLLRLLKFQPGTPIPASLSGDYGAGAVRLIRYRMEAFVGHQLQFCGWWDRNEKRIKKERAQFKYVKKVMES